MFTDLGNDPAPPGGVEIAITADAFKKWMKACHYHAAPADNPGQEVFYLAKGESFRSGNTEVVPNWHITAMLVHRRGGNVRNFHFKIEVGKAASHYWHYTLYRNPVAGTFHWVGDPNPQNNATNEGGGGAAGNLQALQDNKDGIESMVRICHLDHRVTRRTQATMCRTLRGLVSSGRLQLNGSSLSAG